MIVYGTAMGENVDLRVCSHNVKSIRKLDTHYMCIYFETFANEQMFIYATWIFVLRCEIVNDLLSPFKG